ncbi:UNVERIFIED_CONTAM: Retinoblastoma- protein 1 [Siphonaria sp. JEL0065]|nr:Retinoblastoma- protein 1 [Siphonaria sp. JEL0065]
MSKRKSQSDDDMDESPPHNTSANTSSTSSSRDRLPLPAAKRQHRDFPTNDAAASTATIPQTAQPPPPQSTSLYAPTSKASLYEEMKSDLRFSFTNNEMSEQKLGLGLWFLQVMHAYNADLLCTEFSPKNVTVYTMWMVQTSGNEMNCKKVRRRFEALCANSSQRAHDNLTLMRTVYKSFCEFVNLCRDAVTVAAKTAADKVMAGNLSQMVQVSTQMYQEKDDIVKVYEAMELFMGVLVDPSDLEFERDFVRYCWILFLLWRVALHLNNNRPDFDQDIDWVIRAPFLYTLISTTIPSKLPTFNAEIVFNSQQMYTAFLHSSYFKPTVPPTTLEGLSFPSYGGTLGHGANGAMTTLLEVVNVEFERLHEAGAIDFDFRLVLPAFRVFATPKRQRALTVHNPKARTATDRCLKTIFARASVFSAQMPCTPISARTNLPQEEPMSMKEIRASIERGFGSGSKLVPVDQDSRVNVIFAHLSSTFGAEYLKSARSFTNSLKSMIPNQEKAWDLVVPIYIQFLETFVPSIVSDKKCKSQLLLDKQYHQCLLFCAYEVVRFSHELGTESFDNVLRMFEDINYIELYMVLDLLQQGQFWLTRPFIKRFMEIRERILESEVWTTRRIYDLLGYFATRHLPSLSQMSEMVKLYTVLLDPTNKLESAVGSEAANDPFKGIQSFNNNITNLLISRAADLCEKMGLSDIVKQRTAKLIQDVLNMELEKRLLQKRHVDVMMLCALFSVCRLNKVPISWIQLLPFYEKQPQACRNTTMLIFVEEGKERLDIGEFYNRIFLPAVAGLLQPGENLQESVGLQMFSPLRRRADTIQSMMRNQMTTAPGMGIQMRSNRALGLTIVPSRANLFAQSKSASKLGSHSATLN